MIFRKAIVVIHGFAGGIYDLEYLIHRLELVRNYDVYAFTLAGHDGLFKSNMDESDWIKSAEEMIEFLIKNKYKKIYVIGHSMGGVIASNLAVKYKEIKKIVFVSAAFKHMGLKNENFSILEALKETPQLLKDYPKDEVFTRLIKMPLPAVKEFTNLTKNNEENLKKITIPALIIQGINDVMVPPETADFIYNELSSINKNIVKYDGVTHDVFRSNEKEEITKEIINFLKN